MRKVESNPTHVATKEQFSAALYSVIKLASDRSTKTVDQMAHYLGVIPQAPLTYPVVKAMMSVVFGRVDREIINHGFSIARTQDDKKSWFEGYVLSLATAMCFVSSDTTTNPREKGWWDWLAFYLEQEAEYIKYTFDQDVEPVVAELRNLIQIVHSKAADKEEKSLELVLNSSMVDLFCSLRVFMLHPDRIVEATAMLQKDHGSSECEAAYGAYMLLGAYKGQTLNREKSDKVETAVNFLHSSVFS